MAVIVPRSFRLLDEFPGHWGMGKAGKSQFAPSSSHPYAQTWWKSKITPALFPGNIFNGYPDTGPPPATWPPATWPPVTWPLPLGLPHNARHPRLEKGQKGEASGGVLGASGFSYFSSMGPWLKT